MARRAGSGGAAGAGARGLNLSEVKSHDVYAVPTLLADHFLRAMMSERTAWADRDFTCTGLKKPLRAKCARSRVSLRSALWVASDLSA
jgi:hypothetical protein